MVFLMAGEPDIAETGALLGDRVRAAMLLSLLDKTPQSAGQLAFATNVSPQTASFHLRKLTAAALLKGEREGRNRVYRLAGAAVANAIESLAAISKQKQGATHAQGRFPSDRLQQLRTARTCYDHLAGLTGVLFHDSLLQQGYLIKTAKKQYSLTDRGSAWLKELGISRDIRATRSPFARPCLDWSERRPHLAGHLAAQLLNLFLRNRWLVRVRDTRAVRITDRGFREFERQYALNLKLPQAFFTKPLYKENR